MEEINYRVILEGFIESYKDISLEGFNQNDVILLRNLHIENIPKWDEDDQVPDEAYQTILNFLLINGIIKSANTIINGIEINHANLN